MEWLKYGWPSGRLPTLPQPKQAETNHTGALEHPKALHNYIKKEKSKEGIMGPYETIPFDHTAKVGISPLSTRPKKESEERRIILDLSFPQGHSVNDGMEKDKYIGFTAILHFPKVDELAERVFTLGQGAMLFKVDLSRYFRQLPLDPGDYPLIGYMVEGRIYFDKVLPMGMRTAPYIAQRVTNALAHIHRQMEFFLLNYVDDFWGAEPKETVWQAYRFLTNLLRDLKVDTSPEKLVPPTTRLEFLGITFNTEEMTMTIPDDKMSQIKQEMGTWQNKTAATRKEIESLIGKLQFMAKCVRAGRIFLSRLIQWLRGLDRRNKHPIPQEARKDIAWWGRFAQQYNGKSILWLVKDPTCDKVIASDACKRGYGAICGTQYLRGRFPQEYQNKNIALLEMLAVLVALKVWATHLKGKYFWIHVDNQAVAAVINSGASRDPELQDALRELALIAAQHQFVVKAKHIPGVDNRIPDWLSRWGEPESKKRFNQYTREKGWQRIKTPASLLKHNHDW